MSVTLWLRTSRSIQNSGSIDLLAYTSCVNVETHWSVSTALNGEAQVYSVQQQVNDYWLSKLTCATYKYLIGIIMVLKLVTQIHFETVIENSIMWAHAKVCMVLMWVRYACSINSFYIHHSNHAQLNSRHTCQLISLLRIMYALSPGKWVHCFSVLITRN